MRGENPSCFIHFEMIVVVGLHLNRVHLLDLCPH